MPTNPLERGDDVTSGQQPLEAKVRFLSDARNYPEVTRSVTAVETHLSWLFLTDRHAYKLKKPVRHASLDLRTPESRRLNCLEEVRLNRRLTQGVYIGVLPFGLDAEGALTLADQAQTIDWLVAMRRLPESLMLDRSIRFGRVTQSDLRRVMEVLVRFYLAAASIPFASGQYCARQASRIEANRADLLLPVYGLRSDVIDMLCVRQTGVLERHAALLDGRARAGRVVEGHGDLRPEHVCLESPPQINDCLEFSRDLRIVDPVDELAFLGLECEHLGAPDVLPQLLSLYRELSGDAAESALVHFYASLRAMLRARLAAWHLTDPSIHDKSRWSEKAIAYLALAGRHVEQSA